MIYERIKAIATEKGLPIYQLEKAAGIGNGVIAGWKESAPRVDTLKRVAEVLGVTIDELVKE